MLGMSHRVPNVRGFGWLTSVARDATPPSRRDATGDERAYGNGPRSSTTTGIAGGGGKEKGAGRDDG
jgi:hypothetical protein